MTNKTYILSLEEVTSSISRMVIKYCKTQFNINVDLTNLINTETFRKFTLDLLYFYLLPQNEKMAKDFQENMDEIEERYPNGWMYRADRTTLKMFYLLEVVNAANHNGCIKMLQSIIPKKLLDENPLDSKDLTEDLFIYCDLVDSAFWKDTPIGVITDKSAWNLIDINTAGDNLFISIVGDYRLMMWDFRRRIRNGEDKICSE